MKLNKQKGELMMKKKILCSFIVIFFAVTSVIAGIDFSQEDYEKAKKGERDLSETRLEGVDFSGRDLSGFVFSNADLEGANFQGANLTGVNFEHADLEKTNFIGANLTDVNFYHADLDEANLKGADIKGTNFDKAELEYATWTDGRLCAEGSIGGCW